MEKKDLYLSDEEIRENFIKVYQRWVDPPMAGDEQYGEFNIEVEREISKASADYAVKKVIEYIEVEIEGARVGTRLRKLDQCLQALKKLIET